MRRFLLIPALFLACLALLAEPIAAGKFAGKWDGASGASGDIRVALSTAADGKWTSEVVFTLNGQDVKCDVKSVSVSDSKLRVVYTFELQGYQLESTIEGELSGQKLSGTYRTRAVADSSAVDEGTWSATAK